MSDQEASTHFNWIGIISDRLICAKQQNLELALLSLSFLENKNFPDFSNIERPQFPITVEQLSDAKFYSIIVSALVAHKKSNPNNELFNIQDASFNTVLSELSNESYFPQKPCDSEGLENCHVEHHINLCRSIEYFVLDNAISIDLLTSDLRHLPRSFFVLPSNITIDLLEDAISLWLSKFHCNIHFNEEAKFESNNNNQPEMNEKLYHVQLDTSKFAKVAACLARIFPKEINKQDIKKGDNEEEVEHNKKLSCVILNELHAFVPHYFPVDERLFVLFIADLYYATRSGVKRFVKVDAPPLPQFDLHLPQNNLIIKPPTSGFSIRKQISQSPSAPLQIAPPPASPLQFAQKNRGSQGKFISQPKIIKPKVEKNDALSKQKRQNKAKVEKDKKAKAKPKLENKPKIIAEPIILGDNQIIELAEDEIDQSGVVLNDLDDTENLEKYGFNYLDPNGIDKSHKDIIEYNSETSDQNSEKDQVNKKNKCLEFPELELLLHQLIEKKPENGPYYNKLYDTFLSVMKQAMIINYPDVSEIFNFTKSTFEKLLRNEELDYDFEEVITCMLQKYKNQSGSDNQNSLNNSNQDNQLDTQEKGDESVKGKSNKSKIPIATNKKSQKSDENKTRGNKDGADQMANDDSKVNPNSGSNKDNVNERNQDGSGTQASESNDGTKTNQNTNDIQSNKVNSGTKSTNNNDKLQSITNNDNQENCNNSQQNKDSNTLQSKSRNGTNSASENNDELLSSNGINNQDGNLNDGQSTSTNNDDDEQANQKNDENQGSKTSGIQASKNTDRLQIVGNTIDSLTSNNNSRSTNENTNQHSTADIESKLQNRSSTDNQSNLEASTTNKRNDGNVSNSGNVFQMNKKVGSTHENDLNNQNPTNEEEEINQNENSEINEDATSNQNVNNKLNEGDNSGQNDNEVDTFNNNQNSGTNVEAHSNENGSGVANSKQENKEEINQADVSNQNGDNEINEDGDSKQENNEEANSNEKENDLTNQDGDSTQEENEEVNQEDNSNQNGNAEAEDDGVTDEMILREAENMISLKKTGKLKQLSSAISASSKDRSKRASTVPNYQTIVNALKFTSMPQPKYKPVLNEIIDMLQDFKEERILLLMASRTRKFKGIYVLISDDLSAMKLWGQGPNDIKNQDVGAFYKYINGQKTFEQIATKSFTQTTDGFSMKKNLEKKTW